MLYFLRRSNSAIDCNVAVFEFAIERKDIMASELTPEGYARALNVASDLRSQLERQLIGRTSRAWRCGCGTCGASPSRVVAIDMPTTYPEQIARWQLWRCEMRDHTGKRWSLGIDEYIPCSELYVMFRNAFAGIPVETDHPCATLFHDQQDTVCGDHAGNEVRRFTPSGRTIVVGFENPAYVQPVGDLTNSSWVNAELRIEASLIQFGKQDPMLDWTIACNVDAFAIGQPHGPDTGVQWELAVEELQTFYITIPDAAGKYTHHAIARLISVDVETGQATFELAQGVELFRAA